MAHVFEGEQGTQFRMAALGVLILLGLFLAAKTVAEVWELAYIGAGVMPANVISVTGEGDVVSVPDIAEFTFSIVERSASVPDAQAEASTKSNEVIAYLKGAGVEEKNIKTIGYSVYPQYEWYQAACAPASCPPGRQVLTGYEVRETVTVKVTDTAKAGELLSGVGEYGATEVSGLAFTTEDADALRDEARGKAIDDAKQKADALAKQLGVRLIRVVGFNESNDGYPVPYYGEAYGRGATLDAKVAPEIPMGENKIVSNVTIMYEIR